MPSERATVVVARSSGPGCPEPRQRARSARSYEPAILEALTVNWFSSDFPADRADKLASWSLDAIVEQFLNCEIGWFCWEPAKYEPRLMERDCHRASFPLIVDPDIYDAFFNAPAGYRGQFAKSEKHGDDAQRQLIEALFPRLLEVAAQYPTAPPEDVTTSLRGKQAKIWYDENEAGLVYGPESIDFHPWDNPHNKVRAPRGTTLEIKGGWVSSTGEEVINPSKCDRSRNLTKFGHPG